MVYLAPQLYAPRRVSPHLQQRPLRPLTPVLVSSPAEHAVGVPGDRYSSLGWGAEGPAFRDALAGGDKVRPTLIGAQVFVARVGVLSDLSLYRAKTRQNEAQNRVLEVKKLHLIPLSGNYMVRFALFRNLRGCHMQIIRHLEGSMRRKFATSQGYILMHFVTSQANI